MNPRSFLRLFLLAVLAHSAAIGAPQPVPIDRQALVQRHNPVLSAIDIHSPLSVGNGEFAFTVDVTGLQTLQTTYFAGGIPLETLARWAWHSEPNPKGYSLANAMRPIATNGKVVNYPTNDKGEAGQWLRRNPHDFPLAEIGWVDQKGRPLEASEISDIHQTLDLWTGVITSHFRWHGYPVDVTTIANPTKSAVSVHATSRAIEKGYLKVQIAFPRGHDAEVKNTPPLDWSRPETHHTLLETKSAYSVRFLRVRDDLSYQLIVSWDGEAAISPDPKPHVYFLESLSGQSTLEFNLAFGPMDSAESDSNWYETKTQSAAHWQRFWNEGGVVDFSGSSDPRAFELERRVVLSQYLTAIQYGGSVPPSETGLTSSSWYGKHNSEMVWWHLAHFALWGHPSYAASGLNWFKSLLPEARETAKERNLTGARWSKMVGPDGRESPGGNPLIDWNQPHPIYLAELLYRNHPSPEILKQWKDVVFETADCMASMLNKNASTGYYDLGPPLWIAQELYDPTVSRNSTYELSYWSFALEIAQQWRVRLGLKRSADWDDRIAHRAPLPTKDGLYVALESQPDTWQNVEYRHDHPSFLMALGALPGSDVDRPTMRRTLDAVLKSWDWETKIWGWDYPMIAMTATRLDEPDKAMDILLSPGPNNEYSVAGHCPQRGDLALYLPANSSLLSAVALMVAGWDGGPALPGIPKNGAWTVRFEGIQRLP